MATNTVIFAIAISIELALSMYVPDAANAAPFTPLEWQQEVREHAIPAFRGQRKNVTWIRDRDRNFIDDEIRHHFRDDELVNVIVDLNKCLTSPQIRDLFSKFGRITYKGKFITFVLLDGVRVKELPKLALMPQVAMIEWQVPMQALNDIGSRTIQSRYSKTFSPNTAEEMGPSPSGYRGNGVGIAIVDTGVDLTHEAFPAETFAGGYDAIKDIEFDSHDFTNHDSGGHGTHVAGIALGRPTSGRSCRIPDDGSSPANCGGVATGAKLVDVKVCRSETDCPTLSILKGLDWIGMHTSPPYNIRVANISLSERVVLVFGSGTYTYCPEENGQSATAQMVNYLVAQGIAVAVAHGNKSFCGQSGAILPPQINPSPGDASFAMTVQGIDDGGTILRTHDTLFSDALSGPRGDFTLMASQPNLLALKPDLSAPAEGIISAKAGSPHEYTYKTGTSMATPHVAGAAAVVLEAVPAIDPGSLKDLFQRTADFNQNGSPTYPSVDPHWQAYYGSGIINVGEALKQYLDPTGTVVKNDVKFPHCVGPPTVGRLCQVSMPHQPWDNSEDIKTIDDPIHWGPVSPKKGEKIFIAARVQNSGATPTTVLINFGVYEYAGTNTHFYHLGTVPTVVPTGGTDVWVYQEWTPAFENHQCIQVTIQYGLDSNFDNNVTQLNLLVAPSRYDVRIENPFMVPARMEIRPQSNREGWKCRVSEESFVLDPFEDCPRTVQIAFDAPPGAAPGEEANCDVAVYATPTGSNSPVLVGGVTAQTFVPRPCRFVGQVVDKTNRPVPQASVTFSRLQLRKEASDDDRPVDKGVVSAIPGEPVTVVTDRDGVFSLMIPPSFRYRILVSKPGQGKGELDQSLECGLGGHTYILSEEGMTVAKK